MVRGNCSTICKILSMCRDGADKHDVLHQSDLKYEIANLYLDLLVEYNFIHVRPDQPELYEATPRGIELRELLKSFENN
jgi:predicted transcriptional regulator